MTKHDAWYVLALPDTPAAAAIAGRAAVRADLLAHHPSGRPWLMGCVPQRRLAVHDRGPNRLALVGATSISATELGRASDRARSISDLAGVSARVAGSYCVLGSLDGHVYAQGSAMGVHRVFHGIVDGVRVVCDRADILAELGGYALDDDALALRLVRTLPHPFPEIPLWRGVNVVAPQDYLTVPPDGIRSSSGTWWHRPEPQLSRAEGATRLREVLAAAADARTAGGDDLACDLSGGLDSTPLCYFAARGPRGVIARTVYNDDPGGREDLRWAGLALPAMPGVREQTITSTDELPAFFGGLTDLRDRLDEPSQSFLAAPRIVAALRTDAAHGISTHLNGLGGDQVLCGLNPAEHTLFRRRPLLAWRRARAMHIADGYRARATARQLLDRRSYSGWLQDRIDVAVRGGDADAPGMGDWSFGFSLPAWLTARTRDQIITTLRAVAEKAEATGPDRATHLQLSMLRDGARVVRGTGQLGPRTGVAYEAPMLDDHVASVALAVRGEERVDPVEWKPLMKAAMRGLLPEEFLRRTTKNDGSSQGVRGFAAHHHDVRAIVEESGLADAGTIDMDLLNARTAPDPTVLPDSHLNETVNLSLFLRNQAGCPAIAGPRAT